MISKSVDDRTHQSAPLLRQRRLPAGKHSSTACAPADAIHIAQRHNRGRWSSAAAGIDLLALHAILDRGQMKVLSALFISQ